jgi:hypothetical protein
MSILQDCWGWCRVDNSTQKNRLPRNPKKEWPVGSNYEEVHDPHRAVEPVMIMIMKDVTSLALHLEKQSQDNLVIVAMSCELDSWGLVPSKGKRVSLLHSIGTYSGAHPCSYPVGSGAQG